ncbi:MAG TPA: hypothetical protein PKC85_00580 [Bacteroidia bacterium]|jgi:hypothetical protein|nr:hypothetical protein [Bacteroidia bacterium]HMU18313.1 hypothetical protein [Bacteroidia bacterium]
MKKKIPLTILESLQPIVDKNTTLTHAVKDESSMFKLVDNDSHSDFYFLVAKQEVRSGHEHFLTEYKPTFKENTKAHAAWIQTSIVAVRLKSWLEILGAYSKIQTIYDDPILKSYEDKFIETVDILDKDADSAPFNLEQQLYLDEYLSATDTKLENLKADKTEEEINQLSDLQLDAKEIRKELTKLSKRQAIKRLTKFWAKAQKVGLDVIKEIFVSVTAELTKRLLTGGQ